MKYRIVKDFYGYSVESSEDGKNWFHRTIGGFSDTIEGAKLGLEKVKKADVEGKEVVYEETLHLYNEITK